MGGVGMGPGGGGWARSGDVRAAARARGVELSLAAFGPGFRAAARAGGREVGWVSGFVVPAPVGILHLDGVQVLEDELRAAGGAAGGGSSGAPGAGSGAASFVEGAAAGRLQRMRGMYGLGLLLGAAAVCHGAEAGCRRAELLAINDGPPMYRRLVRHYERLGFRSVREVGENGLSDLPHLLVWGGEGMRMDATIEELLEKWSPTIRMMARQGIERAELRPGA